jgi:hypothetical protein
MAQLTRAAILAADDLKREEVPVPEWGGSVFIGSMTGAQRDAWEQSLVPGGKGRVDVTNVRAKLVAACAVDATGARLFEAGDAEALGQKSAAALERCAQVAQRLNGLTEKALEDARGNSSADLSAASTSSSPTDTAAPSASC